MTQEIFEAVRSLQQFQLNCFSGISSLTHAQTFVLLIVGDYVKKKNTTPQPSQLSDYLQIAPASVTPVLNKLENAGYIERIYSKQDRRQVFIELTEKGKLQYQSMAESIQRYYQNAINELGLEDISQFIEFGKKIQALNEKYKTENHIPPYFKNCD